MIPGTLAETIRVAMQLWDAERAAGASRETCAALLERTLRAAWPQRREWKYLCEACRDYGLIMGTCPGDDTCGRDQPHGVHDYGRPCLCAKGRAFKPAPPSEADHTEAGKKRTPKPQALGEVVIMAAYDRIAQVLRTGPHTRGELMAATGYASETVQSTLWQMRATGELRQERDAAYRKQGRAYRYWLEAS